MEVRVVIILRGNGYDEVERFLRVGNSDIAKPLNHPAGALRDFHHTHIFQAQTSGATQNRFGSGPLKVLGAPARNPTKL
jgi:hypothetical protein